ncbi:YbdD/YjiX family protein [Taylorella equigenitalis]|uniref:YbdD/YjiX family protein n=3 Tax=Taylorella equigenitalis TaxID=29575 RepID=I7IBF5_9BURK|nr:YbdD/YjiX family protein [Taylorella equigenitalis]ADU91381.1 Hypothetical small protein yjiX [Taylorella equigenitalis MCE9]AFN36469.1 hypothetical protein KUI_1423 [Taylorella equigenitalis ATCC 35865]ASY31035.1 hypothetical protein B9Z30_06720 [Taylorella equigenitalis]ASY38337.1 DUF466 domain-containing protein [Taylorella equigenitalis]ASY39870.1 DUF466 domain-containing protein [Taylorella equigenitalis]
MLFSIKNTAKYLGQTARLMVGVPDYDTYLKHMERNHPDKQPMTYKEFFRERQDARYGGNGNFKCC